jgi:hypothetical protein
MVKKNQTVNILIAVVAVVIVVSIGGNFLFSTFDDMTMSRSVPSTVLPGETFIVTYSTSATGTWAATIQDSVSGGCTFVSGEIIKTFMLNSEGPSESIQVIAPSSGTCTFSGDYQFGTSPIKQFQNKVITIQETANGDNGNENGDENGDANGNGDDDPPSFDLNQVLFKLGDFEVTILHLLILIGALFVLKLFM